MKVQRSFYILLFMTFAFSGSPVIAQDITFQGGDLTTTIPGRNAIQAPAPNLPVGPVRDKQVEGFAPFHKKYRRNEGAGPLYINNSCGGCHINNGKGSVRYKDAPRLNAIVIKVALHGLQENGAPTNIPGVGDLLQDRVISRPNKTRFERTRFRWRRVPFTYPDGTIVQLRKPKLRIRIPRVRRNEIASSIRMTPGIVGPGLLESIPEETILSWSDPEDSNGDGISGRPQYVLDGETGSFLLGRFGFRASQPSVRHQSAGAAAGEMGLTTSLNNSTNEAPEISDEDLETMVLYQKLAGVPIARNQSDPSVQSGKELFQLAGCHDCHKFNIRTSNSAFPELNDQLIHPFTDLLLHDMGEGLADTRPEFSASGAEWKTTPLWGIGFLDTISRVRQRYLHDGRAQSLEEAILWHGGEAENSRSKFVSFSKQERASLISFLESL